MRSEWTSYKIGEIFELVNGYAFKSGDFISSGIPVLKIKNVKPNNVVLDDLSYVSVEVASRRNDKAIRRGDILITMSGNRFDGSKDTWVGKVAYFDISGHYMLNQRVGVLRPREGVVIDRKCAAYFLSSDDYQKLFISIATSSGGQANLSPAQILGEQLHLPPIEEQARISELLGGLDDRITLLRETNATLEAIAQALFKSWFVDFDPVRAKAEGRQPEGMDAITAALFPDSFEESELGLVPKGWTVARLGDVTERITKGTTPTTLKRPFVESGINFVKVESINDDGQLLPEKFAYIDDETHCLLGRSQLKADDVLITIAGTIGRVAVITEDFIPANTNQAVAIVRPDTSKLPSAFVNQFLRLADSKSRMGERVVQAVQANLSLGSLSDMRLVIPPSVVVTKLHDLVFDSIGSKRNSNQQCIRTLTQLRDTLLPRLISGQLRLPEAEATVEEVL